MRPIALLPVAVVGLAVPARADHFFRQPVEARHGIVASASPLASRVGADVLARGGNAVDAAVAVGFALAVTWPLAGNLGGGGFMLVRRADGKADFLDYRERAPAAATRDMYLGPDGKPIKDASLFGWKAVAVPGTVAGLALAHATYGKLPWRALVMPAAKLARDGFLVDGALAMQFERGEADLSPEARKVFYVDGRRPQVGDRLVLPALAATLRRIADDPRDFYTGETGRRIVSDMKAHGGLVSAADLGAYAAVRRAPLVGSYRGVTVITAPPPSAGGALLLEMLHMLETRPVEKPGSAARVHLLVEVMRRAFADRNLLADPDFVKSPVASLIDPKFAATRMADFDPEHATPSDKIPPAKLDRPETTHFSVVDEAGDLVSSTYTLNNLFGAGVVVAGTGVLLNDEMDDFSTAPGQPNLFRLVQAEANAIAPGKRPLSSMTPTLLVKDGKPWLALGSPGGPTIINTVLQVIVGLVDDGMSLAEAVDAPRVHHQYLPDVVVAEPNGLSPDTRALLEKMGYRFLPTGMYIGDAECAGIDPATSLRIGASDHRLGGAAVGE